MADEEYESDKSSFKDRTAEPLVIFDLTDNFFPFFVSPERKREIRSGAGSGNLGLRRFSRIK